MERKFAAFKISEKECFCMGTMDQVAEAFEAIAESLAAEGAIARPDVRIVAQDFLILDLASGKQVDLESRSKTVGRPKLGVIAREVTLLPRHWDWLAAQPGGASVSLRKLVDEARAGESAEMKAAGDARRAQDAAYHFMSAMAGNEAGFEEATRALYRSDRKTFESLVASWPPDVRELALSLSGPLFAFSAS